MKKAITFLEQQITETDLRLEMLRHARLELISENERNLLVDGLNEENEEARKLIADEKIAFQRPVKAKKTRRAARKKAVKKAKVRLFPTIVLMQKFPDKEWTVSEIAERTKTGKPSTSMRMREYMAKGLVERISRGVYKLTDAGK